MDAGDGMSFVYSLEVNDKPLSSFKEEMKRALKTWRVTLDGKEHLVVLGMYVCMYVCMGVVIFRI